MTTPLSPREVASRFDLYRLLRTLDNAAENQQDKANLPGISRTTAADRTGQVYAFRYTAQMIRDEMAEIESQS